MNNLSSALPRSVRESNLELLRILAMLMIVAHHFVAHGTIPVWSNQVPFTLNLYMADVLGSGGRLGVDLFVLISGWFLAEGRVKLTSLVRLCLATFTYSLLAFILLTFVIQHRPWTWEEVVRTLFPVTFGQYWFVSCYVCMYILSPFLALIVRHTTKAQLGWLLFILGLFWSGIPTILPIQGLGGMKLFGNTLSWFCFLFLLAAWMRRWVNVAGVSLIKAAGLLIVSILCVLCWLAVYGYQSRHGFPHCYSWYYAGDMHSLFTLGAAIALLLLFLRMRFSSRVVNGIASCMFGVYLIHDNELVRPWLWKHLMDANGHLPNVRFIFWSMVMILLVFAVCTAVEFVRLKLFDLTIHRLVVRLKGLDGKLAFFLREPVDR